MQFKEEISEDSSKGKKIQVKCLQCTTFGAYTNHEVLKSYLITSTEVSDENDDCRMVISSEFQIIQCQGCEIITFREIFSENDENDETLHPKRERDFTKRDLNSISIKSFPNVPEKVLGIYKETLNSYNSENFILCAAGLRATVEGICTHQNIKDGPLEIDKPNGEKIITRKNTLEGKIYGIYEKGILAKGHADILHEYRFLGNSALHELEKPSAEELALAIEIIEHILESVFEMPVKWNVLKSRRASMPEVEPNLAV